MGYLPRIGLILLSLASTACSADTGNPTAVETKEVRQVEHTPVSSSTITPTSKQQVTGVSFIFGNSVSEENRTIIQESLDFAQQRALHHLGQRLATITVWTEESTEAMANAELSWYTVSDPSRITAISERWRTGQNIGQAGYRVLFLFTGFAGWNKARPAQQTIAHEYFHVLQAELMKRPLIRGRDGAPDNWGATWLLEGSAELFGRLVRFEAEGLAREALTQESVFNVRNQPSPSLALLESFDGLHSLDSAYRNSLLAVDLLTQSSGVDSLGAYYALIGSGRAWQEAFQEAFGISPEAFYVRYAAYRNDVAVREQPSGTQSSNTRFAIAFEGHLGPGSFTGGAANLSGYRFRLTGFDGVNLVGAVHISPPLGNSPGGVIQSFRRDTANGFLDVAFPTSTQGGTYELSISTPDGGKVAVKFEHSP